MANKFDLQTWTCSGLASQGTTHIGDSIATGKTRFITYLRVTRNEIVQTVAGDVTGCRIEVGSVATAAATATEVAAGRKIIMFLPHASGAASQCIIAGKAAYVYEIPPRPSIEHPLFAITGAGNFAGVVNRSGGSGLTPQSAATVDMFVTYYDAP